MEIMSFDVKVQLKVNTPQMNRIFKAVEGKDDITTNFILKFENENTVKLFDFISFENFEPVQITCLGVRNTADKQIQILE